MQKYEILVPPPKAKRCNNIKLIVICGSGWEGSTDKVLECKIESPGLIEFEVPDMYEWIYDTSIMDGNTFELLVEYTNDLGTKKEIIKPVPGKVL